MTDKQFIQFSKKYFGDLDYTKLSEAEYKNLYEQKEAERIVSMANAGKLDGIFDKLILKAEGMNIDLLYNKKILSSTTLTIPTLNKEEKVIIQVPNNDSNNAVSTKPDDTPSPILPSSGPTPPSPSPTPPDPSTVYSIENVSPQSINATVGDSVTIQAQFFEKHGDQPKQTCRCHAALYISSSSGYNRIIGFAGVTSINYTLTLPSDISYYIIVINPNREANWSDNVASYYIPVSIENIAYAIVNIQPQRIDAIEGDYKTISASFVKSINGGTYQPCVSNVAVYREKTDESTALIFIDRGVTQINNRIQMQLGDDEIIIVMAENYIPSINEKEYIVSIPATVEEEVDMFNTIRLAMNEVLTSNGKNAVVEGSTTYNYLLNLFNAAETEWNDSNSPWFDVDTYQEPDEYNYRGNNTEYRDAAHIALHAWLFAMCLTEIVPTMVTGSQTTNVQTELFKKAQELIGYVPLYGEYDIHADVNISRYVAGIIYSTNHKTYESQIPQMRSELGGAAIDASDWDGLGYTRETRIDEYGNVREDKIDANGNRIGYKMATLGYLVNTSLFLPTAPGKRINGSYAANQPLPDDRINHPEMFDSDNNYNIDAGINDIVVSGYQLSKKLARDTWNNQYDNIKKNWIIQSAALARCTARYMFSGKINVALKEGEDNTQYIFEQTSVDTGMAIEGPFSILADKNLYPYINLIDISAIENAKTVVQKFMDTVLTIADNSRFPTYDPNYGRRRPCSPLNGIEGGAYSPEIGNPQNEIYNISLTLMVADNQQQYDKWNAEDQDNHATERPNSYPSGHSAQIWTMAMILSQMDSTNALSYIKGAYKYSIGRTIGRAHWMSDVIYGRLFGTMILPIINAMNGVSFVNGYSAMERAVLGGVPSGNPVISIGVKIINSHGSAVTLDGDLKFTLGNPDHYGNYLGWDGPYNGTPHLSFSNSPVTLAAGEEMVFYGITWRTDTQQGLGRKSPANSEQLSASGRIRNVLLYVGGNSEVYLCDNMSPSIEFEDGQVYDIVIR